MLKNIKKSILISVVIGSSLLASDLALAVPGVSKGQCGIHTLNVVKTPSDTIIETTFKGKFGKYEGGSCQLTRTEHLGNIRIRTGDNFGIGGEYFKYFMQGDGKCASFVFGYQGKDYQTDPIKLTWDDKKKNYTKTEPAISKIAIE